ncbi:MAG: ABC transporter substrate-binding protein [Solirubrobacteraceae bacterium]
MSRLVRLIPLGLLAALAAGCGGGDGAAQAGGKVVLRYALWDENQQPVYEKCAQRFEQRNPGVDVRIEMTNWGDYWSALPRGFIADTAPDVFTDHLAKFPQFAESEVIEPVNVRGVDMDAYLPGLAELWRSPSGKQYGFPKDWDTVAIVVNEGMLADAGVTKAEIDRATWNPEDGGSFERIVARLSVDKSGVRGDEPGFDPRNVEVYGLGLDPNGLTYGQTTWAGFARSTGFELLDKNPWGTHYNYDDPRFAATMAWWRRMIEKGYMPSLTEARTLGQAAMFQGGKAALAIDGSWTIGTYTSTEGMKVGFSPQPAGPEGSWSMYNGLADAIWVGTKHKAEARKWVQFLASVDCQRIVGTEAVVFPAIASEVERAVATHRERGVDVGAFTSYLEDEHTLLYPITAKAPQINLLVQPTIERILLGSVEPAEALMDMNDDVNAQLEYAP